MAYRDADCSHVELPHVVLPGTGASRTTFPWNARDETVGLTTPSRSLWFDEKGTEM